ncbi:MAG: M20 family metallopeptidase [Akkermansiaceae bacterium]|jgi:acetylornithine deacetylase/succinyl-diaminopimelate desuccinylase-like protein
MPDSLVEDPSDCQDENIGKQLRAGFEIRNFNPSHYSSSVNSVLELLQKLVRIPSVNPEGDPHVSPGGEKAMADFLADYLGSLGFQITLDEALPGRPNLIARAPGSDDRPRILLGPHLDTVGVAGMTIEPYSAEVADGKVHGRGTSDTKGPMAAMIWGLKNNAHLLSELPVAVDFIGFMGEESSQPGSRHFAEHRAHEYEFAIVGEPTSLQAVYCTKGCLWATIEAKGKSTHASQPHLGENAIMKLNRELARLDKDFRNQIAKASHPILGSSTINIGMISGGTRPNIVPSHASAQIDIRTVPLFIKDQTAATQLKEYLKGVEVTQIAESPPMEMKPDHPWLTKLKNAHPDLVLTGAPWFSDAAHLSAAGLPSICLGPGSIDQAHTADEFINISDLEAGAAWFTQLIRSLHSQ